VSAISVRKENNLREGQLTIKQIKVVDLAFPFREEFSQTKLLILRSLFLPGIAPRDPRIVPGDQNDYVILLISDIYRINTIIM